MTNALKIAFDKIAALSDKEQDQIAAALIAVVDENWGPDDELDQAEWDAMVGSEKSLAWLDKMVEETRQDLKEGRVTDMALDDGRDEIQSQS